MLHSGIQAIVCRSIVLALIVRSRFHSTSISTIHHPGQTTFDYWFAFHRYKLKVESLPLQLRCGDEFQTPFESCLLLLCAICPGSTTVVIPNSTSCASFFVRGNERIIV